MHLTTFELTPPYADVVCQRPERRLRRRLDAVSHASMHAWLRAPQRSTLSRRPRAVPWLPSSPGSSRQLPSATPPAPRCCCSFAPAKDHGSNAGLPGLISPLESWRATAHPCITFSDLVTLAASVAVEASGGEGPPRACRQASTFFKAAACGWAGAGRAAGSKQQAHVQRRRFLPRAMREAPTLRETPTGGPPPPAGPPIAWYPGRRDAQTTGPSNPPYSARLPNGAFEAAGVMVY